MSRSYRQPYITQGYGGKARRFYKRLANKAVRRTKNIVNGGTYRKVYCSWMICDFKFRWSETWADTTPRWKVARK